jgi:hypothetical protein
MLQAQNKALLTPFDSLTFTNDGFMWESAHSKFTMSMGYYRAGLSSSLAISLLSEHSLRQWMGDCSLDVHIYYHAM